MTDLIIAIDPGANGAICSLKNGRVEVVNMPKEIFNLKQYFQGLIDGVKEPYCFIERVHAWVKDDAPEKRFGIEKLVKQYNQIKTVMEMLDIPFHETNSRSWQKTFLGEQKFKNTTKGKSERKAKLKEICEYKFARFPYIKVTLKNCDALLILLYANQEMQINRKKYIVDKPKTLF